MRTLFDTIATLRTSAEMATHIADIIRHFPAPERRDVAEELIDRAARRGAIDTETVQALETVFLRELNRSES